MKCIKICILNIIITATFTETGQHLATIKNDSEISRQKPEQTTKLVEAEILEQPKQEMYYDKDTRSIKIKTKFNFKGNKNIVVMPNTDSAEIIYECTNIL